MNINKATSYALRYMIYVGISTMVVGLAFYITDNGDHILWAGLLILILSPLMGVIVTTVGLIREKDVKWIAVALILVAISVANILLVKI